MTKNWKLLFSGLVCLAALAGSYIWVNQLMASVYDFRSPLSQTPPVPGEMLDAPQVRRVVVALVDGLRLDTAARPEAMPFLAELRAQGAWARMHSRPPSYSQTGYSVLFTGAWPDVSDGPAINVDYAEIPTWTQDNLFSAAKRRGLTTAVSGYNWFEKLIPAQALDKTFFTAGEDLAADVAVMQAALPWLQAGDVQLVLIHLDQVDYAGHHEGGPLDVRWDAAAGRVDEHLRQIAAELDWSQDVLLVVSDHGHINAGGHGGHDAVTLLEPWLLVGATVLPGDYGDVQMTDVAPTLAVLLGTNLPASAQGSPRLEMLDLPPAYEIVVQSRWQDQQQQLAQVYSRAIGLPVTAGKLGDLEPAQAGRQQSERAGRLWLVIPLLGLLLLPLLRDLRAGVRQSAPWLGVLIYWGAFHLLYGVLAGRSYSLSSVRAQSEVLLLTMLAALAALALSWLALWLLGRGKTGLTPGIPLTPGPSPDSGRGGELPPPSPQAPLLIPGEGRKGPQGTAGPLGTKGWGGAEALALVLAVLGSLALPLLWSYWLNGWALTWSMPDFASFFLAFLSLLQGVAVAAAGVVLAALSLIMAIAAQFKSTRRLA